MTDETAVVRKVISDSIGWAVKKEREMMLECMAHDENLFYFSPKAEDTIIGYKAFLQLVDGFFMDERFKGIGHEIKDLRINFSRGGDVAWYSCLLDDFNEWEGKPANWINVRWTGVLEKRASKWVIVQMHFSYPQ